MKRLALILFTGLATAAHAAEKPMHHAHSAAGPTAANEAAMQKMMDAMMVKPSGNPDKDFARMMLAHHRGAVEMAKIELQYGKDPDLRTLATDIVAAQEKEIAMMEAWLAKH